MLEESGKRNSNQNRKKVNNITKIIINGIHIDLYHLFIWGRHLLEK